MGYKVLVKNLIELTRKIDGYNNCQIKHLGTFTKIHFSKKIHSSFFENLLDYLDENPEALKWALDNKVIEEEKPKYSVGQIYYCTQREDYWILAHAGNKMVTMINLSSGNLWKTPMEVDNMKDISEEEFKEITDGSVSRLHTILFTEKTLTLK